MQPQEGTTLIEVILAISVICVLAVIAANAIYAPARLIINDTIRQMALCEASSDMERVRATVYDDLLESGTNYTFTAAHQSLSLTRLVDEDYNLKTIIVQVKDPDSTLLVELITERSP
jgi:prepilin-type N-terminal cleavage/methylation domain-containing protein